MSTFCSDCDCVHPDTRKEAPWRWRCIKAPIEARGYKWVSESYSPNPPYDLCDRVNQIGECPAFEKKRNPPK